MSANHSFASPSVSNAWNDTAWSLIARDSDARTVACKGS